MADWPDPRLLLARIAGNCAPRTITRSKLPGIEAETAVSVPLNCDGTYSYTRRPAVPSAEKTKILPLTAATASDLDAPDVPTEPVSVGIPVVGLMVAMRMTPSIEPARR